MTEKENLLEAAEYCLSDYHDLTRTEDKILCLLEGILYALIAIAAE